MIMSNQLSPESTAELMKVKTMEENDPHLKTGKIFTIHSMKSSLMRMG